MLIIIRYSLGNSKGAIKTIPDTKDDSLPDWVKNLFKDFSEPEHVKSEMQDAQDWAKDIIREVDRRIYHDPFWKEFPLIQREALLLKGRQRSLYGFIRANPTKDLQQIFLNSGYDEEIFYRTINYLIQHNYLKLFPVYYSLEYTFRQKISPYLQKDGF